MKPGVVRFGFPEQMCAKALAIELTGLGLQVARESRIDPLQDLAFSALSAPVCAVRVPLSREVSAYQGTSTHGFGAAPVRSRFIVWPMRTRTSQTDADSARNKELFVGEWELSGRV